MEQTPPIAQSAKERKTIYDVSYASIFVRNFLAGFSHALGAVVLYLIIIGIMYYFTATLILPKVQPLFSGILSTLGSGPIQSDRGQLQTVKPEDLQKMLKGTQSGNQQPSEPKTIE